MDKIIFKKTGAQIKEAILNRSTQLQVRLEARNETLDKFIQDKEKLRSYLIRSSFTDSVYTGVQQSRNYMLYSNDDISSEEKDEIMQLCQRIFEIEQELHRLALVAAHIDEEEEFELEFNELVSYGFEA